MNLKSDKVKSKKSNIMTNRKSLYNNICFPIQISNFFLHFAFYFVNLSLEIFFFSKIKIQNVCNIRGVNFFFSSIFLVLKRFTVSNNDTYKVLILAKIKRYSRNRVKIIVKIWGNWHEIPNGVRDLEILVFLLPSSKEIKHE